jgi:hypothetical protein
MGIAALAITEHLDPSLIASISYNSPICGPEVRVQLHAWDKATLADLDALADRLGLRKAQSSPDDKGGIHHTRSGEFAAVQVTAVWLEPESPDGAS